MQSMRILGWVIFVALAIGGFIFFNDARKKAEAKSESEAVRYFLSLMKEDTTVNLNESTGGPVLHPWMLTTTPDQLKLEDQVKLPRTREGDEFVWNLHWDPKGGGDLKPVRVGVTFDSQGRLATVSGLHGTVTPYSNSWKSQ